ncbi:MAG: hemolysin, partial [Bacteroidales bacterium]|nr:hemolysin [Bacteroidales bacterium]
GRLEIDYLNNKYNFNLQESEEFETLAGLIINSAECIPKVNFEIKTGDYLFKILQATETKIVQVKLTITPSSH